MNGIGYVLAAYSVPSENHVGAEMRAMEAQGARIVPILLNNIDFSSDALDHRLAAEAVRLADAPQSAAWRGAFLARGSALRSLAFWIAQCESPRRALLLSSWKLATLATAAGLGHLHAHGAGDAALHAIIAARWAGLSCSFTCLGDDVLATPAGLARKLRAADVTVALCRDMALDLLTLAPGARIEEIPGGVDPDRYAPRPMGAPDNGRYLCVGRLTESQGVANLLRALEWLRRNGGARPLVDVVGDGPQRASLTALAERLGVAEAVRFLGPQSDAWMAAQGAAYRALIAPVKPAPNGERDGGLSVTKEAMALGLPVIASRFRGFKDVVAPDTGLLFTPDDPAALGLALAMMENLSPGERQTMGVAGRRRVWAHFTQAQQAATLCAAIADIREGGPSQGLAARTGGGWRAA